MGSVRYKPPPSVDLFHPTAVLLIVFSLRLSWGSHSLHRQPAKTKPKIIIDNCFQGSNCETRKSSQRELIKKSISKMAQKGQKLYLNVSLHKVLFFSFCFRLFASSSLTCSLWIFALHIINILFCPGITARTDTCKGCMFIINCSIRRGSHIGVGWFLCKCSILVTLEFGDFQIGFSGGRKDRDSGEQHSNVEKVRTNNKLRLRLCMQYMPRIFTVELFTDW